MNHIKTVIALVLFAITVQATEPKAEVIEHCSHDIMKLAKNNQLPPEAVAKLHLFRVTEVTDGFEVLAVLDHNKDHSKPPAHIKFTYDQNAKMKTFEYVDGYFNPAPTVFNQRTTAKLFDIAAEVLLDSKDKALTDYAKDVTVMHLDFDASKNAAVFEMMDSNNKEFSLWLGLDGTVLEYKFNN